MSNEQVQQQIFIWRIWGSLKNVFKVSHDVFLKNTSRCGCVCAHTKSTETEYELQRSSCNRDSKLAEPG